MARGGTMSDETFETSAIVEHITEKAVLIKEAGEDIWLPISQIKVDGEEVEAADLEIGELITIEMPEWLAKKKGLF